MKRAHLIGVIGLLGMGLLLSGCRLNPQTNSGLSQGASSSNSSQPALQPTLTGSILDQSAGEADQSLNDLQNTLQVLDTDLLSIDSSAAQADQSLNDLESTLQAEDISTPDSNSADLSLDNLQATLQAEPTP